MHATGSQAIGSGDMPALVTPVEHPGVIGLRTHRRQDRLGQGRVAGVAVGRPEIEVGQTPLEKPRQHRRD